MLDWLLWWTGLAAWMLVGGGVLVWSGFFTAHRITDIVFVRRIAAANFAWKGLPRRELWSRCFRLYCHVAEQHPIAMDVRTDDAPDCWDTVYYPGHEPKTRHLDEWPAGHGEQPL